MPDTYAEILGDTESKEYIFLAKEMSERGWTAFMRDDNAAAFAQAYVNATGREVTMQSGYGGRIEIHHA